jgi:hypothetical protein
LLHDYFNGEITMSTANLHFDLNPNVGKVDKVARYVVGASLIGVILVVAPAQAGWVVLLPLMAIPIVISAIIGWDPIYALFQKLPTPRLLSSFDAIPEAEYKPQEAMPYQVEREAA